jgi:hypothetical protein
MLDYRRAPFGDWSLLVLDLGSITGFARGHIDGLPSLGTWDLAPGRGDLVGGRAAVLDNTFAQALDVWGDVALVALAEAFPGRNQHDVAAAGALHGVVRAECWRRSIRVLVQPEVTVRKEMLGRGVGPTPVMKRLALEWCARAGFDVADHNAADAGVFWCWVRAELVAQRVTVGSAAKMPRDNSLPLLRGLSAEP